MEGFVFGFDGCVEGFDGLDAAVTITLTDTDFDQPATRPRTVNAPGFAYDYDWNRQYGSLPVVTYTSQPP